NVSWMVWPLPPLPGAALVPRGRRGQSDEPAVSALPQDRAGVARDVLDAGPFAAQRAEETAHRIGVFWAAARSLPRFPLPTAGGPAGSSIAFALPSSLATAPSRAPAASPSATGLPRHASP